MVEAINGEIPVQVAVSWSDVQNKPTELVSDVTLKRIEALEEDKQEASGKFSYTQLINVPTAFPPTEHGHTMEDIQGLSAQLERKQERTEGIEWSRISNPPAEYPPIAHLHRILDVEGLSGALDGKRDTGKIPIADIDGLNAKLASLGQWDSLEGKPQAYPPTTHGHGISDVTGLQAALDSKRPSGDIQISEVLGLSQQLSQIGVAPAWASVTGKPATFPPSMHGHAQADIAGLSELLATIPKIETIIGKVVTAGAKVPVKFTKVYTTPPEVLSITTWNGAQEVVGSASEVTTTGCNVTVMQTRGSLIASGGPFENASAGQSFKIFVIGT